MSSVVGREVASRAPVDGAIAADGRVARSQRTRATIVDAVLELLEEGDLRPTAARIAERAEISDRLIYHHFDDLDALLSAVAARQAERVTARLRAIDPSLPLDKRLDQLVAERAEVFEWITPVRRAAMLQEPFSTPLRIHRRELDKRLGTEVTRVFETELAHLHGRSRREIIAALNAALSWQTWDVLRSGGLSTSVALSAMRRLAAGVLSSTCV